MMDIHFLKKQDELIQRMQDNLDFCKHKIDVYEKREKIYQKHIDTLESIQPKIYFEPKERLQR